MNGRKAYFPLSLHVFGRQIPVATHAAGRHHFVLVSTEDVPTSPQLGPVFLPVIRRIASIRQLPRCCANAPDVVRSCYTAASRTSSYGSSEAFPSYDLRAPVRRHRAGQSFLRGAGPRRRRHFESKSLLEYRPAAFSVLKLFTLYPLVAKQSRASGSTKE
jgi:hypothetical protein